MSASAGNDKGQMPNDKDQGRRVRVKVGGPWLGQLGYAFPCGIAGGSGVLLDGYEEHMWFYEGEIEDA